MKVVVYGAGALGSLFGGLLSRAHDVTLVARPGHVEAIRSNGLRIQAPEPIHAAVKATTSADGIPPPDLLLLSVKAYDTPTALQELRPLMGPNTVLVCLQNGLGNWEQARRAFPQDAVLGASVTYGANLLAPGVVAWNGPGEVTIGGLLLDAGAVEKTRVAFRAGGINVRTTDNIAGALWLKAIINAAINPLTAIHRVPNGRLLEDAALRQAMRRAAEEAVRVARAERVRLPAVNPVEEVERVARMTADNRSSMLQSVDKGLRTEIDAITGAILEAARRHGIPCPENERLLAAVQALPTSRFG